MHNLLNEMEAEVSVVLEKFQNKANTLIGTDAIILDGPYKHRLGQITLTSVYNGCVLFVVQPYRKTTQGKVTEKLLDSAEAHAYRSITRVILCSDQVRYADFLLRNA